MESHKSISSECLDIKRDNIPAPNSLNQHTIQEWNPNLNSQYSFDNFFEGMSNKLARVVGEAVAADPGQTTFNPFSYTEDRA